MAEPADDRGDSSVRELAERLLYAAVGAVALTRDRADELAEELVRRGKMGREEASELVDDLMGRSRGDAGRLGERASHALAGVFRDLGLVTRRDYDELALRVAQLEHRLRLLEEEGPAGAPRV